MGEAELDALIDDLEASYEWREDAPAVRRELLERLPDIPATWVQRARLTLLGVDDLVRGHEAAGAAVTILQIRDRAIAGDHRLLQVRAGLALSRLLSKIQDISAALEHAVATLALDGVDLDPTLRCRVGLALADALAQGGSFDDARDRYRQVLERSRSLRFPWISLQTLNNWAFSEMLAGDISAAWELVERLRTLAATHATPLLLVYSGTVAEVLHARGRSAEAVAMLREHLSHDPAHALIDAAGCWVTLARIERETGELDAAGASLDTADHLTTTHGLLGLRVEGMGERAELLAVRGDHAGAYETHLRFHDQTLALRSAAGDARAQTRHALLEADTARREGARYRQMSYRDPLTQLYNRRHVDEDLDTRLSHTATAAHLLTIAMIDLDHFKRVNDTCSHEAGDAVLARLAELLTDAAGGTPDAYAARLGGEEFLLVLPGLQLDAAHAVAEHLRQTIATHHWADIAPGVPVTASIGLATTSPGAPLYRARLLRRADHHLYAAKAAGRDRVEPAPAVPTSRTGPQDHSDR